MQPSPAQSASAESASVQLAAHGPLVQLMHSISKATVSAATADASATDHRGDDVEANDGADEAVNYAAAVSLAHQQDSQDFDEEEDDIGSAVEGAAVQRVTDEVLPDHHLHSDTSAGHHVSEHEVDGGQSRPDITTISTAQEFFKTRG